MLNDTSSTQALLATRRSGKLRDMGVPGPDAAQLERILDAAIRVPDHGKLAPWRFVIVPAERRDDLAGLLGRACLAERGEPNEKDRRTIEDYAYAAPALIVVLSMPRRDAAIPLWEQELSAGAACMNLLVAAHAEGLVGSWLTGWPAYSPIVREAFEAGDGHIAGFLFVGSAANELQERPRPDRSAVVREWQGTTG